MDEGTYYIEAAKVEALNNLAKAIDNLGQHLEYGRVHMRRENDHR